MQYLYILIIIFSTNVYAERIVGPSGTVDTNQLGPTILFLLLIAIIGYVRDYLKKLKQQTKYKNSKTTINSITPVNFDAHNQRRTAPNQRKSTRGLVNLDPEKNHIYAEQERAFQSATIEKEKQIEQFINISNEILKCPDKHCANIMFEKYNLNYPIFLILSFTMIKEGHITKEKMNLIKGILTRDTVHDIHESNQKEYRANGIDEINILFNSAFEEDGRG